MESEKWFSLGKAEEVLPIATGRSWGQGLPAALGVHWSKLGARNGAGEAERRGFPFWGSG